jgi:hypothetical protein
MLLSVREARIEDAVSGKLVRTSQFEIGGVMLDEVAYGWIDIRKLLRD